MCSWIVLIPLINLLCILVPFFINGQCSPMFKDVISKVRYALQANGILHKVNLLLTHSIEIVNLYLAIDYLLCKFVEFAKVEGVYGSTKILI